MISGLFLGLGARRTVGIDLTVAPTLNSLGGTFTLAENSAEDTVAGAITGRTSGSNLELTDTAGGRVKLSGTNIVAGATATDYASATSHSFTVTETREGATNTPRDTIFTLNVTDATAPTITSSATVSVAENAQLSHALTANESVTWSIVGGQDPTDFEIGGSTLRWVGNGTQDFEDPQDSGADNEYRVRIRATDAAGNFSEQTVFVSVTNEFEAATLGALSLDVTEIVEGEAVTINIVGATAGSSIEVSGSLPAGLTLNSAARTITGTPTTVAVNTFDLGETLDDSANSPRTTELSLEVVAAAPSTLSQLIALLAGNSSAADFTTATSDPYFAEDLSPLGNDWGQDAGGQAPVVSPTLGAQFTVSNANTTLPVIPGNYSVIVSATLAPSDTSSFLLAAGAGSQEILRLISGNGTGMPFPTEVDGVATATRGATWAAAAIGTEVVVMITGVDPSGSPYLSVGRPGSGSHIPGSVRRAVVIDETAVTGANLTAAREAAKTWVAEA